MSYTAGTEWRNPSHHLSGYTCSSGTIFRD